VHHLGPGQGRAKEAEDGDPFGNAQPQSARLVAAQGLFSCRICGWRLRRNAQLVPSGNLDHEPFAQAGGVPAKKGGQLGELFRVVPWSTAAFGLMSYSVHAFRLNFQACRQAAFRCLWLRRTGGTPMGPFALLRRWPLSRCS
jgi:hypothetical protein